VLGLKVLGLNSCADKLITKVDSMKEINLFCSVLSRYLRYCYCFKNGSMSFGMKGGFIHTNTFSIHRSPVSQKNLQLGQLASLKTKYIMIYEDLCLVNIKYKIIYSFNSNFRVNKLSLSIICSCSFYAKQDFCGPEVCVCV